MAQTYASKINCPQRIKQVVNFRGLEMGERMYPTDIDGFIELHDKEYVIFEIKHRGAKVPYGQKLALERMARDFVKAGKRVAVIVCEHDVDDPNQPVMAAECRVREVYYGTGTEWAKPSTPCKVNEFINSFLTEGSLIAS